MYVCVPTSGRDSGLAERNRGKKSGKKNYNPAARAWHGTVVIMRFMTAENVVAIIPDNAASPYNRRRRRRFLLFLLAMLSAKGQGDDFDSTEDRNGARDANRRMIPRIIGETRKRASVLTMEREKIHAVHFNFISTMTLFLSD